MSIDIDWPRLTTGPEGVELSNAIRDFIDEKFQQIELPRFIRSVHVHSFDFGEECPQIEIKDISDPWPDFYEDEEEEEDEEDDERNTNIKGQSKGSEEGASLRGQTDNADGNGGGSHHASKTSQNDGRQTMPPPPLPSSSAVSNSSRARPTKIDISLSARNLNLHGMHAQSDMFSGPLLSRSSTPGISGGTSNLGYFHLPLGGALKSGPGTPLAAAFPPGLTSSADPFRHSAANANDLNAEARMRNAFFANSSAQQAVGSSSLTAGHDPKSVPPLISPTSSTADTRAMDIQTTVHITYSGSLSLSLTAELLLDYPMPSFMGIPLALRITGLTFDGVALLAFLRNNKKASKSSKHDLHRDGIRTGEADEDDQAIYDDGDGDGDEDDIEKARGRCQFCFLGEEEGRAIVGGGSEGTESSDKDKERPKPGGHMASPLKEIRIETEIGRQQPFQQPQSQSQAQHSTSPNKYPQTAQPSTTPSSSSSSSSAYPSSTTTTTTATTIPGTTNHQQPQIQNMGSQSHQAQAQIHNNNAANKPVVLKNVGKVEKFVLEQVRRIFEEEFVWPSFWTFLL